VVWKSENGIFGYSLHQAIDRVDDLPCQSGVIKYFQPLERRRRPPKHAEIRVSLSSYR
jgi:hypothetical protein